MLGASRIAAADINRARLDWALAHGVADDIYHVPTTHSRPTDSVKTKGNPADEGIRRSKENATEALGNCGLLDGFDIVMECTGVESSAQMGIFVRSSLPIC
jgi:L-iditol 2-dehydrogenase